MYMHYRQGTIKTFWSKVKKTPTCWIWQGILTTVPNRKPYGILTISKRIDGYMWRRNEGAHRFSYVLAHGSIPTGLVIDHLCRNTLCVRPNHLRAVTSAENNGARTPNICKHGHLFDEANTRWCSRGNDKQFRQCRACNNRSHREQYQKRRLLK